MGVVDMEQAHRSSRRAVLAGGAAVLGGAVAASTGTAGARGVPAPRQGGEGGGSLLDRIVSDGQVRVGVDLGFEPLQYRDPESNEPTGYSIELTKLMMAELGAEIEYVEIPFSELFAAGEAGRFDISGIQATNLPARGLRVAFAGAPAFLEGNYILLNADSAVTSSEELNSGDITIAVLAGSSQAAAAKLGFPEAELKELQEQPATVEDVVTGRSDAVYIGEFGVADAVNQGLVLLDEPATFASHNTYFMPKGDFPLWAWVTQFLQYKANDLTLRDLWEQFIGAELRPLGVPTSGVVDPWLGAARLVSSGQ
jgi:ABC-type amino acid transport substrate-binding protein